MLNKKFLLGIFAMMLVFTSVFILAGCDSETEYTLNNNSSHTVTGMVGSNSYSVGSGKTTRVMGNTVAVNITYRPVNLVTMTISGGGFTATFTVRRHSGRVAK